MEIIALILLVYFAIAGFLFNLGLVGSGVKHVAKKISDVNKGIEGDARNQRYNEATAHLQEQQRHIQEEVERLRKQLFHTQLAQVASLRAMHPRQFENVIADMYRRMGYSVYQTKYSNDEGKDLVLEKDGHKLFVECKRFAENAPVGREVLQKLVGSMARDGIREGIIVTTGRFTQTAEEYVADVKVDPKVKTTIRLV